MKERTASKASNQVLGLRGKPNERKREKERAETTVLPQIPWLNQATDDIGKRPNLTLSSRSVHEGTAVSCMYVHLALPMIQNLLISCLVY